MKPITVRRIVLAAASFVLALLSLLSLCFVVGKADLGLGGAGGSAVSDLFSDSGFHLLGGNSNVILSFGATYADELRWLEILCQILNILILAASILMIAGSVLWFFFKEKEKLLKVIAVLAPVVGLLYLIEGVLFSAYLNWYLNLGSVKIVTVAYVPLILIAVFDAAFWVLRAKIKRPVTAEEAAAESSDGSAVYEATEEDSYKETKQEKAAVKAKAPAYVSKYAPDRFEVASLQYLRELKALTDEGVLTEQEFTEEKKRFFNR